MEKNIVRSKGLNFIMDLVDSNTKTSTGWKQI